MYYLNMFLIGSIFGFIFENGLKNFFPSINSGLLYGPWVPVYGFGLCIIIFIERLVFNKLKLKKIYNMLIMLLLSMVMVTGLEWLGGVLIQHFFHKTLWDYSKCKFNIGKYISLEITLVWGVLTLLFAYVLKPWLDKWINKIPRLVSFLVFLLITIDFMLLVF